MTHHDQAPRGDAALLDPKLLHLFEVLYTTGSVTRAAELLGQSQPTVSIWLGKLRAQLADPLFVRTMQGMQPTPRADALIEPVREVLRALRRLSKSAPGFDPAQAQRRFVIAMTDASHITLLPNLLAHVRALAPGVVLAASSISNTLAQALQNGQADLALGYLPWLDTGIYQQTLYEQDWICLTNTRHPRVPDDAPEHWNLPVYQAEAHIGISSGTGQHLLENALAGQGITRQVRLELPGFLGLSAILSSSDLIATLPRHIGETLARAAGLRTLPCPFTIAGFTVKQYWHTRYHQDPASRWLRGVCADLFMKSGTGAYE
ncbi:MAG: LysR family transcriptional regulator [Rhodoferax sp.]|nr:LysR family transcriptional regulator [Rhodoferax sp.]